jgi:type I restriction enzyme S subunit
MTVRSGYQLTKVGEIPEDWQVASIGGIATVKSGGTPSTSKREYWQHGTIPWINSGELHDCPVTEPTKYITKEGLLNSAAKLFPAGTVLIALTGATTGRVGLLTGESTTNQSVTGIFPSERYDPKFLYYYLMHTRKKALRYSTGSAQPHINQQIVEKLIIPLPPRAEQEKIGRIIWSIDEAVQKTDEIIAKTQQLKKGLMQQLLTRGIGHTEFKQTEIGVIPREWEVVVLRDLVSMKHGWAFKGEYFGQSGSIVLTPGNFTEFGGLYFTGDNVKRYGGTYPKEYELSPGDLVLVMTDLSPLCKILGNPAFIPTGETILHNQRIGKFVCRSESLDKHFLYWLCLSYRFKTLLKSTATGSTVRHTAPDRILAFRFGLPHISEQKAISSLLFTLESKLKAENRRNEKVEELKRGLMQTLLTGKVRVKVD